MDLPESKGYFVTGTDTGVGKTRVTVALMERLKAQGHTVIGMKPVAAGCKRENGIWVNDDALLLQQHSSIQLPYKTINSYAFELPIAPHLAANQKGIMISLERLVSESQLLTCQADYLIIEGAGGWEAPLNEEARISDLAKKVGFPVILVVGLRLGCINHALLSVQAIQQSGQLMAGWVANQIDPNMECLKENIETLQQQIESPLLEFIPWQKA